jgi:hypothetical protein
MEEINKGEVHTILITCSLLAQMLYCPLETRDF